MYYKWMSKAYNYNEAQNYFAKYCYVINRLGIESIAVRNDFKFGLTVFNQLRE